VQAVVIVPTFDRPEMLWNCLDHLAACRGIGGVQVRVHLDYRAPLISANEVEDVTHGFVERMAIRLVRSEPHRYRGNSFNLLTAMKLAHEDRADVVYIVEDDVMVSPDFLGWHQSVHFRHSRLAASIGVAMPTHGAYASLGVCLPDGSLATIVEHATQEYFGNMRVYCDRTFPPSQFDVEQDGLIARALAGYEVAWAPTPVAAHVGWYGYHRKDTVRPTGMLRDRVEAVREAISDPAKLAHLSRGAKDVCPAIFDEPQRPVYSIVPRGEA